MNYEKTKNNYSDECFEGSGAPCKRTKSQNTDLRQKSVLPSGSMSEEINAIGCWFFYDVINSARCKGTEKSLYYSAMT